MQLHAFPGGLKLDQHKAFATTAPLSVCPLAPELVLPLSQHLGAPAQAIVKVGQRVDKGELLARANGNVSAHVHAPASGSIVAIEPRPVPHPSAAPALCIVMATDGADQWRRLPTIADWFAADPGVLQARIFEAGVVGLGGAAFPTHRKLHNEAAQAPHTLIINGAECEPYISCDDVLLRQRAAEVLLGAVILARIVGAERILVAVEDAMREAYAALTTALEALTADSALQGHVPVELVRVPTIYPEGGERQLIKVLTGKEVPSGGLPRDIGVLCQNVATAAAAFRAVVHGEALVSRIVTVTGRGIAQPGNFDVALGTPIAHLVAQAGGYRAEAARLIMGGPMMGIALGDDALPIVKASNCVLALSADEIKTTAPELPCIRCGECARVCPAVLLPQQLYWYIRSENWRRVQEYALQDCIECGCCAYVCPSQIPLVDYYRFGKSELAAQRRTAAEAAAARERYETRTVRLQREQVEQSARMAARRAQLQDGQASPDNVAAAIARARARKPAGGEGES